MNPTWHAAVPTDHGSRYLQQLCKHWAHKFTVRYDENQGTIVLPTGRVTMTADADRLHARLAPAQDDDFERLRHVFEEHINRFAFREAPLPFDWTREESAT